MPAIPSSNTDPIDPLSGIRHEIPDHETGMSHPAHRVIGRERELARIGTCIRNTASGTGSVILLSGEAGIGKTSLARSAAILAQDQRVTVLWTRVIEGDWQPPYQSWVEIITQGIASPAAPSRVINAPPWASILVAIVPALNELYPNLSPPGPLSAREEQFRLTDAVVHCLHDLARRSPMLIIFDDIQWCDPESLRLLRHLAQTRQDVPLTILALMRDDQVEPGAPLAQTLDHLRREDRFMEVRLTGLDHRAVEALMNTVTATSATADTVRLIHENTQGNPFFVQELTRHLHEEGRFATLDQAEFASGHVNFSIPDILRQVIDRRLGRLSPQAQHMLRLAAVCTGGFDFQVLSALTSLDEDTLLDAIDESLTARLIVPVERDTERYDFQHALIQRSLYDSWNPSRRIRLHRQLAHSLEQVYADDLSRHAAEISVHYHVSAGLPGAEHGIPHALSAARTARLHAAPDHAITYFRTACDLSSRLPTRERAEIYSQLALAEAHALMLDAAQETIRITVHLLEEADAPPGDIAHFLVRAVTGLHDGGADDATWMPLLYRGLALTPADDELTWARFTLLIQRFEPIIVGIISGSRWLGSNPRAVAIARASDDEDLFSRSLQPWDLWEREWTEWITNLVKTWQTPNAIIRALTVSGADWLYHHGDFRRALSHFADLLTISEQHGSIPGQAEATVRLGIIHTILGNQDAARLYHDRAKSVVARLGAGHRLHASLWWLHALRTDVEGGDWSEIASFFVEYVADPDLGRATIAFDDGALAALAMAQHGQTDEALLVLRPLADLLDRLEPTLWLLNGAVGFGAAAVWALGAVELAAPFRRSALAIIEAGHGDFPGASNLLSVARMATLLDRHEEAADYFGRARTHLEQSGQLPLRTRVDLDEARAMMSRNQPDFDRALSLARAAQRGFAALSMASWQSQAIRLVARIESRITEETTKPAGLTQREIDVVRLVARGFSDRQISEHIFVSPRTVHAHLRNILGKTRLNNRTELSVWAIAHHITESE